MAATLQPWTSALPDLMSDYARGWALSLRAARKSERTQRLYLAGLKTFADFLESRGMPTNPTIISGEHVREFLADQTARLSPATARARHAYLSVFFNYLVGEGELKASPMARIKPPALDETMPDILSDEHYAKLLRVTQGRHLTDRRDHAMIMLLENTGLRRAECASLTIPTVDLDEKRLVVMGKGRVQRPAYFDDDTASALFRYLAVRKTTRWAKDPALWIGHVGPLSANAIGEMLVRRCRQAGIPPVHPHAFRHRFADSWKRKGGSEDALMSIGGWKSREVMARYGRTNAARRAEEEYRQIRDSDK